MSRTCNGLCQDAKVSSKIGHMGIAFVFCNCCGNLDINSIPKSMICPCCHTKVRTHPRSTKSKKRNQLARIA